MKKLLFVSLIIGLTWFIVIPAIPACSPGDPTCIVSNWVYANASIDLYNYLGLKQPTMIPVLPSIATHPYYGVVRNSTRDFAKFPLEGVKFADETITIIAVIDIDKAHKLGMLNPWEARQHILKKIKKLKKKYKTENICVITWTRDGAHHYGFEPSSASGANPTGITSAMGGGTFIWGMDLATQMVSVEYCIYK